MENTEENRQLIKILNKSMKMHDSRHRLYIRYRKPVEGKKYGWGGSLACEDSRTFAVYLTKTKAYNDARSEMRRDSWKSESTKMQQIKYINSRVLVEAEELKWNCDHLIYEIKKLI